MPAVMTEQDALKALSSRFSQIQKGLDPMNGNIVGITSAAYERRWHKPMSDAKKAVLSNSLTQVQKLMMNKGVTRDQIASAVEDISKVDNPLSMLFNLMSILIPNFAYTEVMGIQPMPTKKSPIFYPQLTAAETRNGFTAGESLLGASSWNKKNTYTTNKNVAAATLDTTTPSVAVSFTAAQGNIIPKTLVVEINLAASGTAYLYDDGEGHLTTVDGFTSSTAGTVNYSTGAVAFDLAANPTANDSVNVGYRYDFANGTAPAQAIFEWTSKDVEAQPYRLRSSYTLDNFYQAKQVLNGYDIDSVLSSSIAGYINKEISGNVFDEMLEHADAGYSWSKTVPTGVAWALHRLSILQKIVEAGNAIRANVKRSAGNILVAGTDWMNVIETLGDDVYKPEAHTEEPIGPYVAGNLLGRFKVLKNQDYADNKAMMCYKKSDTDASQMGGVFIGLYATDALAMSDLQVVQGMGTVFGTVKAFENSVLSLSITN